MKRTPNYRQYLIGGIHHGKDKLDLLPGNHNDLIRFPKPMDFDPFNFDINESLLLDNTEIYRRERMSIFGIPIDVWLSESDLAWGSPHWQAEAGQHVAEILLLPHIRPEIMFGRRKG